MAQIEKYEKDGMVAVLVSPGYGAGWSTWVSYKDSERSVFDPDMVRNILGETDETMDEITARKYPDEYYGGIGGLIIEWVPKGESFSIEEYDGSESIRTRSSLTYTA